MNEVSIMPLNDLKEMANTFAASGMFGKTREQMLALMCIAQAENLHPAIAAMEYDVIQGRPALKGQAALARFQQAGGSIKWLVRTDTEAKATFSHPKGSELTVSWTMEKARKMALADKDNWKKQPGVMLSWRTVAEGVRAVYPACLNRMYLAEEVQDFEPMRDVTPEPVKPAPTPEEKKPVKKPTLLPEEREQAQKASALQKELGIDKLEAAEIFNACGNDVAVYIRKLEAMKNTAAPEEPDFQLSCAPTMDEIYLELEEYAASESTPETVRKDIAAAINGNVKNIDTLSELLRKVKAACK